MLLVILLLSCEGPFADEQSFTANRINQDEISSMSKGKGFTSPRPAQRLVTGLQSGSGSTIGPGGDLFVTEGAAGRILRVDPKNRRGHDVRQRIATFDHWYRRFDGCHLPRRNSVRDSHARGR